MNDEPETDPQDTVRRLIERMKAPYEKGRGILLSWDEISALRVTIFADLWDEDIIFGKVQNHE